MSTALLLHRVRATNTAPESENKIHDDSVAARYGFRGGLVPGVTVYGYMTVPIVASLPEWLERGTMTVRFVEPVYDGDEVIVKVETQGAGSITVAAERADGTLCAKGTASIEPPPAAAPAKYPEAPLPPADQRPIPTRYNLAPGAPLGTITAELESDDPAKLLQFSNDILVRNFRLGPWIHVASEIRNWSAARPGDEIFAHGRIHDRFDRKGHEFVVLDVMLIGAAGRLLQTVRHTAIYGLRSHVP